MRRVAIKRTPMTKKKTKRLDEYDREFERMKPIVFDRAHGYCEALAFALKFTDFDIPTSAKNWETQTRATHMARGVHVHHRKYRKRGGTNALNNLLLVCESCHSWIHAHGGFGAAANLLGLALSAEQDEALPNLEGTS